MANRFDERGYDREFDRERGRDDRTLVSRDFMTNEPRYRGYGEMTKSWNEPSRQGRMGREDLSERGEWNREPYGGEFARAGGFDERTERGFGRGEDYGRSRFDESIAGRPSGFYGRYEGGGEERWNRELRGRDFGHEGLAERAGWSQSASAYGTNIGQYAGRGPKGYKRADDRIHEDVCEVLTRHPGVDASEIEVRVNNGEVTLTGNVEDRHQKRLAEDAVENLAGVRDVHNQVRVKRGLAERIFGGGEEERREEPTTRKGSRRAA